MESKTFKGTGKANQVIDLKSNDQIKEITGISIDHVVTQPEDYTEQRMSNSRIMIAFGGVTPKEGAEIKIDFEIIK